MTETDGVTDPCPPRHAYLRGGDNRPVVVPMWLAEFVLDFAEEHVGHQSLITPPVMRGDNHSYVDSFRALVEFYKQAQGAAQ